MASINFKSKTSQNTDNGIYQGLNYTPKYDYSGGNKESPSSPAPTFRGNAGIGDTQFRPSSYLGSSTMQTKGSALGKSPQENMVSGLKYGYGSSAPMTNFPEYYQQSLNYNKGLQAARQRDMSSGSGMHIYEKAYGITHQMPQAKAVDNSLAGRMQQDLGGGSKLVNPLTDNAGYEWNKAKLMQAMGYDDTQADHFMNNANLNWKAYEALKKYGAIVPNAQTQQYLDYQQSLSMPSYSESLPSYVSVDGSGDYSDNSVDYYPQTEDQARNARHYKGDSESNSNPPTNTPQNPPSGIANRIQWNLQHTYSPNEQVPVFGSDETYEFSPAYYGQYQ